MIKNTLKISVGAFPVVHFTPFFLRIVENGRKSFGIDRGKEKFVITGQYRRKTKVPGSQKSTKETSKRLTPAKNVLLSVMPFYNIKMKLFRVEEDPRLRTELES